jgi:hypothetical protein
MPFNARKIVAEAFVQLGKDAGVDMDGYLDLLKAHDLDPSGLTYRFYLAGWAAKEKAGGVIELREQSVPPPCPCCNRPMTKCNYHCSRCGSDDAL